MQIHLKNIGIVKESVITLNGLTVITGKNNSGKTTVGKTLYSLLDAVSNLKEKVESDRCHYIREQLIRAESMLSLFFFLQIVPSASEDHKTLLSGYPAICSLISHRWGGFLNVQLETYVSDLITELSRLDLHSIFKDPVVNESLPNLAKKAGIDDSNENILSKEKEKALALLSDLQIFLEKDKDLINYTRESINQTLISEFDGQIQPVRIPGCRSKIKLSSDSSVFFDLAIAKDQIIDDEELVFFRSPFSRVFLVDDPFILDDNVRSGKYRLDSPDGGTILNPGRILTHAQSLRRELQTSSQLTILEQTRLNQLLKPVKERIDQVFPGTFDFSSQDACYIQNGVKLKIANMATGSKMFSIIKMLLEKGKLDDSTMLILDEPEAHLHPMWQNHFAEIIALLVKELNVNVLLTTHSSNFMLALDAYMRKHQITDKANFYQTEFLPDGMVQYQCVNDNMNVIYQDFLQYMSDVKMLRSQYMSPTDHT